MVTASERLAAPSFSNSLAMWGCGAEDGAGK